jgi:DNA end-binding protein Ku
MVARKKKTAKARAKSADSETRVSRRTAPRPAWQGHLRLSLVSCPVALINATTRANDVSFHLLNPDTNNRIRMVPTDPDTGPVERSDLVKGYEVSKDEYVIVTEDELDEVKLESTHTLEIERFVDAETIDRLFWNDPYFLVPDGDTGVDAYTVIRDAMEDAGRIALGRVVMHTRERLVAIEPRGKGLIAYTLRTHDEVLNPVHAFRDVPGVKPDKRMIEVAQKIIDQPPKGERRETGQRARARGHQCDRPDGGVAEKPQEQRPGHARARAKAETARVALNSISLSSQGARSHRAATARICDNRSTPCFSR